MASKSTANRRSSASKRPRKQAIPEHDEVDEALEDALAYEHDFIDDEDDDDDERGYIARASGRVREMTRQREGRIVVAALACGFALGAVIGCVIANSRQRNHSWADRLAGEGVGGRMLDRIRSAIPDSITEKLHRS